jgi:MFS family permease
VKDAAVRPDPGSDGSSGRGSGLFYGYVIAILTFCIFLVAYGIRFSYGVFFQPMSNELGWSSATTSLIYSISMLMEGIFNIILGRMIDRYGPRLIATFSGCLVALGYGLMPTVHSTWQFFLLYAGVVGIGMGGLFGPLVTIIPRWFTARRNLVNGLVISSVGIGILIASPLANQLIKVLDWRTTFLAFGLAIFLVVTVCAQFLKRDPYSLGLLPYGETADRRGEGKNPVAGFSLSQAARTYQFWFIFLLFFAYGFAANAVSIHIVPDAIDKGISAALAATILATIGGLQIAGRIGLGLAADRLGERRIATGGFALFALLTFLLPAISHQAAFFIFAAFFGLTQGGLAVSQSPLVARYFGVRSLGLLFGFCGFGFTLGAAAGPYITGKVFDLAGNYGTAFLAVALVSVAGFFAGLFLKPLQNKGQA